MIAPQIATNNHVANSNKWTNTIHGNSYHGELNTMWLMTRSGLPPLATPHAPLGHDLGRPQATVLVTPRWPGESIIDDTTCFEVDFAYHTGIDVIIQCLGTFFIDS